ncbi:MAG: ABC transporter substrate-binding protein [Rhodospirillum sp.]|nr:ABC transporter substrate-binding protein [Rhodospirillum sp.]MCF8491170.1 ABC transporter substrate-binding protein [Rhodospirillum sp.]MCF8502498.1 ABC transporter substrate-binding protein [Rhodospirillum sp.]
MIAKNLATLALSLCLAAPAWARIDIVDLRDRHVTLEEPAKRVLLGFYFEDFMAITGPGAMDRVVALSTPVWKGWRVRQYEAYVKAIPSIAEITDVGDTESGTFSIETAIAAKPDLALLAAWQYDSLGATASALEEAGIPIVVVDYNAQTLERHLRSTRVIGQAMGAEDRAEALAALYESAIKDTLARVTAEGPSGKSVYVELAKKGPSEVGNTYGKGMWGGIIDMVGGENIAKGQVENWGPLAPEYVLSQQPDVILLAGSEWTGAPEAVSVGFGADPALVNQRMAAYLTRPGWSDLPAVRNDDVYAVYHGGTRTLSDYVYVQYIAKILYPEAFKDIDPMANLAAFYHRWLPIEAEGVFATRYGPAKP